MEEEDVSQYQEDNSAINKYGLVNSVASEQNNSLPSLNIPEDNKEPAEVGIIKALSFKDDLQEFRYVLEGKERNEITGIWEKKHKSIMNAWGIKNIMTALRIATSKIVTQSNYAEDKIPKLTMLYYSKNSPHYKLYAKDFELDEKDFNIVDTALWVFSYAAFSKGKGAGDRNTVRGVYSEDTISKIASGVPAELAQTHGGGFMDWIGSKLRRGNKNY